MKNNKYVLAILVFLAISNNFAAEDKKKESQLNSTNLLAITTGITISAIQNLIANYSQEFLLDKILKDHDNIIESLAISPCDKYIISGSFDTILKIWNFTTGNCEDTFKSSYKFDAPISSVQFSPNGKNFVAVHSKVRIWDTNTRQCIQTIDERNTIKSLRYSPCSKYIAYIIAENPIVKILDINTNKCLKSLIGHIDNINYMTYSPCGNFIATSSVDNSLKIWDSKTSECIKTIDTIDHAYVFSFSPDSKKIALGGIYLYRTTGRPLQEMSQIKIYDLDPDSKTYGKSIQQLANIPYKIISLEYSKCGKYLLLGFNGTVKIWNTNDNFLINIDDQSSEKLYRAIYSTNGLFIITAYDNNIKIFKSSIIDLLGLRI